MVELQRIVWGGGSMTFERATELMESKTPVFTFFAAVCCGRVIITDVKRDSVELQMYGTFKKGFENPHPMTRRLDDVFETDTKALEYQIQKALFDVEKKRNELKWHQEELRFHEYTLAALLNMRKGD